MTIAGGRGPDRLGHGRIRQASCCQAVAVKPARKRVFLVRRGPGPARPRPFPVPTARRRRPWVVVVKGGGRMPAAVWLEQHASAALQHAASMQRHAAAARADQHSI